MTCNNASTAECSVLEETRMSIVPAIFRPIPDGLRDASAKRQSATAQVVPRGDNHWCMRFGGTLLLAAKVSHGATIAPASLQRAGARLISLVALTSRPGRSSRPPDLTDDPFFS